MWHMHWNNIMLTHWWWNLSFRKWYSIICCESELGPMYSRALGPIRFRTYFLSQTETVVVVVVVEMMMVALSSTCAIFYYFEASERGKWFVDCDDSEWRVVNAMNCFSFCFESKRLTQRYHQPIASKLVDHHYVPRKRPIDCSRENRTVADRNWINKFD